MPRTIRLLLVALALLPLFGTNLPAQEKIGEQEVDQQSKIPSVVRLGSWRGHQVDAVLSLDSPAMSRSSPITLKSAEEATPYFNKDLVAKWEKQVDFEKQNLLVWSWSGSGQDNLECYVSLSKASKVLFMIEPGFTKDWRRHVHVFAVRKDLKWSANSIPVGHIWFSESKVKIDAANKPGNN